MPITSSTFSPTTGIRLKPLRRASASAWRTVLSRSMKTMSVRGTITPRTSVSPSSNTEWIICRSSCSMTWRSSARSTRSRSSASLAKGPSRKPFPGVRALPTTMSNRASGPSTRVSATVIPAARSATRGACCWPIVRGATPTTT